VNLERVVTPTTRLGGHIVLGHVDGVGTIERREPGGGWEDVTISAPAELLRYVVENLIELAEPSGLADPLP
jgi:riboflavin synthase